MAKVRIMRNDTVRVVQHFERKLRSRVPVKATVQINLRVNLRGMDSACGRTFRAFSPSRKRWEYVIEIDAELSPDEAADTVVHEWAHVLSWSEAADHGKRWGVAYAKCYRATREKAKRKS